MRIFVLVVAAAGLLLTTPSCRKGDNDPLISLKSRKARLAGKYEFISWESSSETLVEGVFPYRTHNDINIQQGKGTVVTTILPVGSAEVVDTKIKNIQIDKGELIIDKDGKWELTMNITLTWREEGEGVINDYYEFTEIQRVFESGRWKFPENEGDTFKSEERVLFSHVIHHAFLQSTMKIVFEDGSSSTLVGENQAVSHNGVVEAFYEIDGLKNKEMILKRPKEGSKIQVEGVGLPIFVSLITEGMVEMHLTQ
jgi:hypothetical protein